MRGVTGILAAVLGLVGAVLHGVNAASDRVIEPSFWLMSALGAAAFGLTGAALEGRGLRLLPSVLSAVGLGQGVALVAREYALLGAVPLDAAALWVGSWLWAPSYLAALVVLPLVLPDGRLPSPRWRPALWLSALVLLGQAVVWALTPYELQDVPFDVRGLRNPVGIVGAAAAAVVAPLAAATVVAALLALASLVLRWRASTGERRQQLKWLGVGGAAAVVLALAGLATPHPLGELVAALVVLPVPVAAGVAALRHRLWDVDLVVSRGLRYAIVSAVVVAVYVAVVTVLGASAGTPVVAAALVAVLLLPVHTLVQRWVNEWVHGEADDPTTALARLGERLEATADPADVADHLLPDVVERLSALLHAEYVAVELVDGGIVERGRRGADTDRIPLRFGGSAAGTLVLARRERTAREQRRLDALARQASVAVHSVLLAREARRARRSLVAVREEERRALRRELHDGVGPVLAALALQTEVARDLVTERPGQAAELLDGLVQRLNGAVADVRALVHELRPPTLDELGLAGAVRELAGRFGAPELCVEVAVGELDELPAAVELAAYRIVGEALANAVRHGAPQNVDVVLEHRGDRLHLEVRDDGSGVAPHAEPGLGVSSMRTRAEEVGGTFEQRTSPQGTAVVVDLPLVLEGAAR